MKIIMMALVLLLATVAGVRAANWDLVWADEFDSPGLPDKSKWDYEEGFVRNRELQYYTRARLENARVEGGNLVIECRKERFTPPNRAPVEYTSASLITKNRASWQYGRIEVKAKLPQGKGVWPAIWTLGVKGGWPAGGEIDIMEYVGKEPDNLYATLHYALNGKHQSDGGKLQTPKPADDFHLYAVEWDATKIDFFFDRKKYRSVLLDKAGAGADNPFRKPHYLLLNFALGGSWGGAVDNSILPQKYLVDYVRVYRQRGDRHL